MLEEEDDEGVVCARFGCVDTLCKKYKNNARRNLVAIADYE